MIVRKTGGAVPRLRLISVPPKRGNRFRTFISFALSFMLVASGFYGATSLAQSPPEWGGTVEVDGSVSALTLRAGESVSYRIRLTEQPLADQNDGEWFVRIHVNDVVLIDGIYPPGNRDDAMITWVPSVGWEFDRGNWDQWRTITIRAHKNITTPIRFMHEVWATSEWCPIHNVGKITVSSEPTPPDGPVLRAEKNGKSQIDLTWVAPDDNGASISRYALQVSDDGASGWTNLASSLGASARAYSHTNLSPGTEKHYQIRAYNPKGAGGWSNVATATTESDAPGAPVLRAEPNGEMQIDLSWDEPATNGAPITRYELEVSDDGSSNWSGLGGRISSSTRSHPHTGLSAGTKKYYQIRAYNSEGFGPWRAASATTQSGVPDAPVLNAAANGETEIDLTWAAPADNGADITHYELQVSDNGTSGWSGLGGRISASAISYTHTNLSPGTRKYYQIRAHNSAGSSAWSDPKDATTQMGVPGKPVLSATASGMTQIDLSWSEPADNGASINSYELQDSDDGITWTNLATNLPASPRTYNHTPLSPGTRKYYQIRARNSQGPSAWSDPKNATTQADVPDAPVLNAEPNGQRKIDLTWDAPPDNGASISRYELQVSDDGVTWTNLATNIGSTARSYSHSSLSPGTEKYYQIRARNSQGPSVWSAPKNETTLVGVPDAPVLRAAANGQTIIDLSWDEPANNGMSIDSYELEVSDDGNSWEPLNSSLPSSDRSYSHADLSPGTRKYYQIRAHNSIGSGEWSAPKSATTQSANNGGGGNDGGNDGGGNGGNGENWDGGGVPRTQDPPTPISATVDGNKLVLTYNELLDRGSMPAPGDFTVSAHDVESVDVSGSRVTMILETPAMPGEVVTLSYAPGEKLIQNNTGVDALPFTDMPVENIGKAPVLVNSRVRGDQLTLTYDEALDEASVPTTGSFTVMVDGVNRTVSRVEVKDKKVTLTLETPVEPGESLTLSYEPGAVGSPSIVDLTAIPAAPISDSRVNNPIVSIEDRTRATNHWLSRFGRTVASQAVETIESRLKSPSMRQESSATLAGQNVNFFDDDSSFPLAQDDPDSVSASRLASRALGFGGLPRWSGAEGAGLVGDGSAVGYPEMSMSDLLLASSFHLVSGQNEGNGPGVRWTAWGRGAHAGFHGYKHGLTVDGDVTTGTLGADYEWGRTMVGVALSQSRSEGYFSLDGQRSETEARLMSAFPYMRYKVSERLMLWGMFGFGKGDYTQYEEGGGEKIETDISMRMGAFGFRSSLVPLGRQIGYDLTLKSDVLVLEIEAKEVPDKLLPVDVNTSRFRLLLEGSREYKLGHGASITPSLTMGVRYDSGDTEEGGGLELGGGFRFFDPALDMVIDISARGLLVHEETKYRELGVAGSVHLTWGNQERGLSMRVGSSWGDTTSGVERIWSQSSVAGLGAGDENARFEAEVGYGMDAPGGALIKPYAGIAVAGRGSQTYRLGGRLRMGKHLSMNLQGERRERVGGDASHGIGLFGSIRW